MISLAKTTLATCALTTLFALSSGCLANQKDLGTENSTTAGATTSGTNSGTDTASAGSSDGMACNPIDYPPSDACDACTCVNGVVECLEECACEDGASMPAPDGCNTCTCENGFWGCTEIACMCEQGAVVPDADMCGQCVCTDNAWICDDNCGCDPIELPDPACITCECDGSGEWLCDDSACIDDDPFNGPEIAICGDLVPLDAVSILDAVIIGDILTVNLSYSGGCAEHLLGGCWDGAWTKLAPPIMNIEIAHNSMNDPCDAIESNSVQVDLTGMAATYVQEGGAASGTINIQLAGWPMMLTYSY